MGLRPDPFFPSYVTSLDLEWEDPGMGEMGVSS